MTGCGDESDLLLASVYYFSTAALQVFNSSYTTAIYQQIPCVIDYRIMFIHKSMCSINTTLLTENATISTNLKIPFCGSSAVRVPVNELQLLSKQNSQHVKQCALF